MSSRKLLSPLLIGALLLAAVVVYLNLPAEEQVKKGGPLPTTVKTILVEQGEMAITIEALGTARANESIAVTAQVTETVRSVNFEDGDSVKAGQVLIQLNNNEELARVAELRANIDEAKRQYTRIFNLRESSAASEQLLDEQQARVKGLEAQLDIAEAQVDDLQIRAPFSGVLGARQVSIGSLVQPAGVITTVSYTHLTLPTNREV